MTAQSSSLETIEDFLAEKRIAMVGISRDPANFSVKLFGNCVVAGMTLFP